jgi:DNA-binding SARP family transcriptional activator
MIQELRDMWYGFAVLLETDRCDAVGYLRQAVESMVAGDRLLELPAAAVYLAEAEWRAGNEDAADRAADLALDAARRQGANHVLLQALADVPTVASRRIDAEPRADSPWHDIGRALIAQDVALGRPVRPSAELMEFGRRAILVNGQEVRPRIAKTYELLSLLTTRRPPKAQRGELLDALFEGRADQSARSYLRQAIQWLRQSLPDGAVIVEGAIVGLGEGAQITTDSSRFEAQVAEAARLQGEQRFAATLEALEIYDRGEFLPGPHSTWADERAQRLSDLATDARFEAAEIALAIGRYGAARRLTEHVLADQPFREGAWRLAMRVADALGDDQGVLRAYHECERALAEVGATPSPSTRQLLEALRR